MGDCLRVSVVIPTYNRPNYLAELLESILRQTFEPLEVLVVDDNTPTDVIKAVCEDYLIKFESLSSRLIYVRNHKERSAATARNIGAKMAQGDLTLFLDDDILLYPNYIEKIVAVFLEHPNALGVQGWDVNAKNKIVTHPIIKALQTLFRLQHYVKDSCKFTEYPYLLTKTINCEWLRGANLTIKREVFTEFRFDETLKKYSYLEDLLFSYSIQKKYNGSIYITPDAKYVHKTSKGREGIEAAERRIHLHQYRKYVLRRLFGMKGWLIYYWQNMGMLIIDCAGKIWSFVNFAKGTPIEFLRTALNMSKIRRRNHLE